MRTITICGIALAVCAMTSGCASIFARSAGGVDEFYVGAKTDWAIITEGGKGDFGAYTEGLKLFAVLDLPLSAILDTVLLPIDLFLVANKSKTPGQ
jgi:uncharacterized protein YceK